jgi:hypothetical protein
MADETTPAAEADGPSSKDTANHLHQRLLAGEPTAREHLARRCLGDVARILARTFPSLQARHPDWIDDAAVDAVMAYLQRPESYDPQKAKLLTYLVAIASNKLRERRRAALPPAAEDDGTRLGRVISLEAATNQAGESVGINLPDEKSDVEEEVLLLLDDAEFIAWLQPHVTEPEDWAVLDLLLEKRTDTSAYAAAVHLDATAMSAHELAGRAYAHKERLKKRLRRLYTAYKEGRTVRSYTRRDHTAGPAS